MLKKEEYDKMSDEELVHLYHNGDGEVANYLVEKYKNLVRMKARMYFLVGADSDDVIQEGMIGLFNAICSYNPEKNNSFMAFASLCIDRKIITKVDTYNSYKNFPLNTSLSLDKWATDEFGEEISFFYNIVTVNNNPEEVVIAREQDMQLYTEIIQSLSKMEKQIFELFIKGMSYAEIGCTLNKSVKSVDNAVQRIRKKTKAILEDKKEENNKK